MVGEKALLGIKFLLARTGHKVDFAAQEREMLWHAADRLSAIKDRFNKMEFKFSEPDIDKYLDQFTDRLMHFSESGKVSREITYKEYELISFYLDRLYMDSGENKEIEAMINDYINNEDFGYDKLQQYFAHCQYVKHLTNDQS